MARVIASYGQLHLLLYQVCAQLRITEDRARKWLKNFRAGKYNNVLAAGQIINGANQHGAKRASAGSDVRAAVVEVVPSESIRRVRTRQADVMAGAPARPGLAVVVEQIVLEQIENERRSLVRTRSASTLGHNCAPIIGHRYSATENRVVPVRPQRPTQPAAPQPRVSVKVIPPRVSRLRPGLRGQNDGGYGTQEWYASMVLARKGRKGLASGRVLPV